MTDDADRLFPKSTALLRDAIAQAKQDLQPPMMNRAALKRATYAYRRDSPEARIAVAALVSTLTRSRDPERILTAVREAVVAATQDARARASILEHIAAIEAAARQQEVQ